MTENHFDEDDLFESRRDSKNEYSTFIQELQQSTEKLMNEVFNTEYVPEINQKELHLDDLSNMKTKSSLFDTPTPVWRKHINSNSNFNASKRSNATRCTEKEKQMSESFVNFLVRNQKWKQRRIMRAKNEHNKKQQQEIKNLTFIPKILSASRQKDIDPIYERCLNIQKERQKKLALKRIEKQREQAQKQSQCTFKPAIKTKSKNRTLQEYLKDKYEWSNRKQEHIENEKLWQEVRKHEQCIFRPILVAKQPTTKNSALQSTIQCPQRVEDRLLRSLEKSIEKKEQIIRKTEVKNIKTTKSTSFNRIPAI